MDFDREISFSNPNVHFYRTSFSSVKITRGMDQFYKFLNAWVSGFVCFFFLLWPNTQSVRCWNLKNTCLPVKTAEMAQSTATSSDLQPFPPLQPQLPGHGDSTEQPRLATTSSLALAIHSHKPHAAVLAPSHKSCPQAASGPLELRELHQRQAGFLPLSPHRTWVPALAKPQDLPLSNLMLLCAVVFN